MLTAQCI